MMRELADMLDATAGLVPGTGRCLFHLGRCRIYIVSSAEQLPAALAALRSSMCSNPCVALDLEWRPDVKGGQSTRVALLQLASASVCVLVRTCRVPFCQPLHAFLSDPAVTLVGFDWDGADERKMQLSFGLGRAQFGGFLDLALLAQSLAYYNHGVAKMCQSVLGIDMGKKGKKVAISNWEADQLSLAQIKYAACDVLATYHVYCQLRQWQLAGGAAPACPQCSRHLGAVIRPRLRCAACTLCCPTIGALLGHGAKARHDTGFRQCEGCSRVYMLEAQQAQQACWPQQEELEEEARLREEQEIAAGVRF